MGPVSEDLFRREQSPHQLELEKLWVPGWFALDPPGPRFALDRRRLPYVRIPTPHDALWRAGVFGMANGPMPTLRLPGEVI